MSKPECSTRLAQAAAVVLGCALAGCSNGSGTSSPGQKASSTSSTPSAKNASAGIVTTVRKLPSVGKVTIQRGRYGVVIVDQATRGKHFSLSGEQAGECLSFLKANPSPSRTDLLAACPGHVGP